MCVSRLAAMQAVNKFVQNGSIVGLGTGPWVRQGRSMMLEFSLFNAYKKYNLYLFILSTDVCKSGLRFVIILCVFLLQTQCIFDYLKQCMDTGAISVSICFSFLVLLQSLLTLRARAILLSCKPDYLDHCNTARGNRCTATT